MTGQIVRTARTAGGAIDIAEMKRKSCSGFAVEHVRIAAPAEYEFRTTDSSSRVCLINLCRSDGETSASDAPRSLAKDLRNKLTFVPPDCGLSGWSKLAKPGTVTSIAIEPTFDKSPVASLAELPPRLEFEDQMLRWVMLGIGMLMISNVQYAAVPTVGFRSLRGILGTLLVVGTIAGVI